MEGGWSGPRNYATGNNLYKAETDPENFARGGARGNITAGGHVLNAIFASFYVCLGYAGEEEEGLEPSGSVND